MVNASLTGAHPLCNNEGDDASRLTNLFHALFQHYTSCTSPMADNCIQSLRTLVGLGFTTCLADEVYTTCYQPYLTCFLKYDRGNFQKHPGVSNILANGISSMLLLAIKSFQTNHCSVCYQEFMKIIKDVLEDVIIVEIDKRKEARHILKSLQRSKKRTCHTFIRD